MKNALDFALLEESGAAVVVHNLRNRAQGKIARGEIVCIHGDCIAQKIDFAMAWGSIANGVGEIKSDRLGGFGDKFHKNAVGGVDICGAGKAIRSAEIHAAEF